MRNQDPDTTELVRRWISGWVVSRGAAEPAPAPWGWSIDVGAPTGEVARRVLPHPAEDDVREIAGATTAPGTWLKLFAEDDTVRPWLGPEWRLDVPGFLMSLPRGGAGGPPPHARETKKPVMNGGVGPTKGITKNGPQT
ncbi:hypothetical protein ACFV4G_23560, partial [Kitasatospora sp. NPDC059747]